MLRRLLYPSLIGLTLFGGCRCFDQCDIPSSSLAQFDRQGESGGSPSYDVLTQPQFCTGVKNLRLALEPVSGDAQSAPIGALVPARPTVRLLTSFTRTAVHDVVVTWTVTGGGGALEGATDVATNHNGTATAPEWRLGGTATPNTITATVDALALGATVSGSPLTFTATATPAATIGIFAGNTQTGAAGSLLTVDPEVIVLDANGTPVPNFPVAFAVTGGSGQLLPGAPTATDPSGRAKAQWRLGAVAGPNTLTVTAAGPGLTGSPVTFTASGVAGPAHTLLLFAGDNQTALRATAVALRPAVLLEDVNRNPVPDVQVTFTATQGGGSVQGATATTDAGGVATVGGWTLGPNPGENRLSALAAGAGIIIGNPVGFTATATAPVPASIVAFAGDGQTGSAGVGLPIRPAVRVSDATGAPVAGEPVLFLFVAAPGIVTGSISGASQTTDQNGVATVGGWTLANQAGSNRLHATVLSPNVAGDPVTFNATGVAGLPVIMAKVAGDNQSAPAGFSPEVLPTVRITDFFGNPVAGVTLTFAVTGGGGTITGAVPVTNALGRATVGSWQLGPAPGPNTLSATASATTITGNPVTFTANGFIAEVRTPLP